MTIFLFRIIFNPSDVISILLSILIIFDDIVGERRSDYY